MRVGYMKEGRGEEGMGAGVYRRDIEDGEEGGEGLFLSLE